jgi:hypothetical protein
MIFNIFLRSNNWEKIKQYIIINLQYKKILYFFNAIQFAVIFSEFGLLFQVILLILLQIKVIETVKGFTILELRELYD